MRTNFISFFEKICALAQASATTSVQTFLSSTTFTNQLITRTQFDQQINDTLTRFQHTTPISFARTLDLMRLLIHADALMAFPLSNWQILPDEQQHQAETSSFFNVPVILINERSNQTCSCATLNTCTAPALIFNADGRIDYSIPGFVYGCYLFQTVLFSSLSCLYSSTCIAELRQHLNLSAESLDDYHVETGNPIQLDAAATRFNINDTIETLTDAMFIESWTSNVSYERYFNSCAPDSCTYTLYYRFDVLELFTTFLSVFSGLSVAVRFAVPYSMGLFGKIRVHYRVASE